MTATDAPITPPPMMSASTSSGGGEPTTTPIWRRAPPRAGVSAAPRRLASAKLRERRPPPPRDLSTISARAAAGLTGSTSSRPGRGPSGGTSLSKTANVNSHAKIARQKKANSRLGPSGRARAQVRQKGPLREGLCALALSAPALQEEAPQSARPVPRAVWASAGVGHRPRGFTLQGVGNAGCATLKWN